MLGTAQKNRKSHNKNSRKKTHILSTGVVRIKMRTLVSNPTRQLREKSRIVSKLSNIISNIGFGKEKSRELSLSDHIFYLLKAAETLNPKEKNRIENYFVEMGDLAVPYLVSSLKKCTGTARGMAAMALIRIGTPSMRFLEETMAVEPEFGWAAEYIINEIKGTQIKLTERSVKNRDLEKVLVS